MKTLAELRRNLAAVRERAIQRSMSDDFYHSNGRYKEDQEHIRELELEIAQREREGIAA